MIFAMCLALALSADDPKSTACECPRIGARCQALDTACAAAPEKVRCAPKCRTVPACVRARDCHREAQGRCTVLAMAGWADRGAWTIWRLLTHMPRPARTEAP